jgi:hypothetical protein
MAKDLRFAKMTPEQRRAKLERERKWRLKNPEKKNVIQRRANLKYSYGITLEEYHAIFQSQGESCAICRAKQSIKWCLDHCHSTNSVRGVLCHHCNTLLGHAKDNEQVLIDAIFYLLKHREPQ